MLLELFLLVAIDRRNESREFVPWMGLGAFFRPVAVPGFYAACDGKSLRRGSYYITGFFLSPDRNGEISAIEARHLNDVASVWMPQELFLYRTGELPVLDITKRVSWLKKGTLDENHGYEAHTGALLAFPELRLAA